MTTELNAKRVLLTGASGMLAGDLLPRLRQAGAEIVTADALADDMGKRGCDITDSAAVFEIVKEVAPDWIINCAAYTKVDDAEVEYSTAFAVNALGSKHLAQAAHAACAKLLHVSTDYVFGGVGADPRRSSPYTEDDTPHPCGIYGLSKRFGDELVMAYLPKDHLIVRTSWLHGAHGHNFVHAIARLAAERSELRVVDDQIGSPTWTGWLAEAMIALMAQDARGLFHVSSGAAISWHTFAAEIAKLTGSSADILTQSTEELNRPAPRPAYSALSVEKLERFIQRPIPAWQEGLRAHLREMEMLKE